MVVTSLPPPACASALALTSGIGRALKAYGGVQVTVVGTPQAPSGLALSSEPVSLKAPGIVPPKFSTTSLQAVAPATSNTLLFDRILAAWPTPT